MSLNSKTKVLHVITRLDPGGSSTNTIETVLRLDSQRFDVVLISGRTSDLDESFESALKNKKIPFIYINDLQREVHPWRDIKAFLKLYRIMKERHFDIVHTHSSKAGILGRWAARCAGVKMIIHTPHGHIFYGYFSKLVTAVFIWIERITARITHKIITLTDRGKQEHVDLKIGPADQFVTIYSGIDTNPIQSSLEECKQLKAQLNLNENQFIFGSVARLDPIKGTSYLIEAMAKIVKKNPHAKLLLVGDGSEREKLQKLAEALGIHQQVIFVGFIKNPNRYIEIMDVFVLASLNEGMGRVILEAMSFGIPVIATKVGGIPELIEDGKNGFLVPSQDSEALSGAMIKMIEQRGIIEDISKNAKAVVGKKFNLEKMVKDIENLYAD